MSVVPETLAGPDDDRRVIDALIVAAINEEWEGVLAVETGASTESAWDVLPGSTPEVRTRLFETPAGTLRIAVVQAFGMGGARAAIAAAPLLERYKDQIRCLAMCGVCAGRRGDVALGDVIIADRSWVHDAGKLRARIASDGELAESFQGDVELYRIEPPAWKQQAERFQPDPNAQWVSERPLSYEQQGEWFLSASWLASGSSRSMVSASGRSQHATSSSKILFVA